MTVRGTTLMNHPVLLVLGIVATSAVAACSKPAPPHQEPPAPVVTEAATTADVPVFHEYPGTATTVRMVEINARVEGWVTKQNFTDGQTVQEGMILYEIDPRPFEVALEQSLADLAVAEAEYKNAKQKVERNRPLVDVEAISVEQFEQLVANERSTKAQTEARRAAVDQSRLNLSYCTVRALSAGQISKTQVYQGTLVGPTVNNRMTNIQVLDPIWVEFNPIAQDIPALRTLMENRKDAVDVTMPPGNWKGSGKVVFIDNHVDASTDTILARLELANADRSLVPGAYVNLKLPVQIMKDAVTIPESALVYQTAASLVWLVQANNTVKSVVVQTGPRGGSGIVVTSGLKAGDRVVTHGQQKLRENKVIHEVKAPAPDAAPAAPPAPAAPTDAETGSGGK